MRRKSKNIVLENIKLVSAGAKGVAVGRTEEGKTVLVTGAVPGDVVNARVKKSKSKYFDFHHALQNKGQIYAVS